MAVKSDHVCVALFRELAFMRAHRCQTLPILYWLWIQLIVLPLLAMHRRCFGNLARNIHDMSGCRQIRPILWPSKNWVHCVNFISVLTRVIKIVWHSSGNIAKSINDVTVVKPSHCTLCLIMNWVDRDLIVCQISSACVGISYNIKCSWQYCFYNECNFWWDGKIDASCLWMNIRSIACGNVAKCRNEVK